MIVLAQRLAFVAMVLTLIILSGGCASPVGPALVRPPIKWSPLRPAHAVHHAYGEPAYFGHHGTCWARWPAGWIACPFHEGFYVEASGIGPAEAPSVPAGGKSSDELAPPDEEPSPPDSTLPLAPLGDDEGLDAAPLPPRNIPVEPRLPDRAGFSDPPLPSAAAEESPGVSFVDVDDSSL